MLSESEVEVRCGAVCCAFLTGRHTFWVGGGWDIRVFGNTEREAWGDIKDADSVRIFSRWCSTHLTPFKAEIYSLSTLWIRNVVKVYTNHHSSIDERTPLTVGPELAVQNGEDGNAS
jgi:hypothetical protein